MDVKEMHIMFDQMFAEQATNRKRRLNPQEIDFYLNYFGQYAFIKNKLTGFSGKVGFETTKKRVEEFKELKRTYNSPAYIDSVSRSNYPSMKAYFNYDHLFYIRGSVNSIYDCNGQTFTVNPAPPSSYKVAVCSFERDSVHAASYYPDFKIIVTDSTGDVDALVLSNIEGVSTIYSEDGRFYIVDLVRERLSDIDITLANGGTLKLKVYWEYYKDQYYYQSFIFEVISFVPSGVETLDSITVEVNVGVDDSTCAFSDIRDSVYDTSLFTGNSYIAGDRPYSSEEAIDMLQSKLFTTKFTSPITEVERNHVIIYHDSTFVINSVLISYLKRPILISLGLNQSCEISPFFHDEIVATAVKNALENLKDEGYQILQGEILNKE